MCVILETAAGPIETVGELRRWWGGEAVIDRRYLPAFAQGVKDDCCLCPVDIAATAAKQGRVVVMTGTGDWEECP